MATENTVEKESLVLNNEEKDGGLTPPARTGDDTPKHARTKKKKTRNRIYGECILVVGIWAILGMVVLMLQFLTGAVEVFTTFFVGVGLLIITSVCMFFGNQALASDEKLLTKHC